MYRDDLRLHPARALEHTDLPAEGIEGRTVVLVDDVLFSGRTIRAALDALNDLGRPEPGAARRPRRPGAPRAADPGRLRRQEPAHRHRRAGPGAPRGARRRRRGLHRVGRSPRATYAGRWPGEDPPALGRGPDPRRRPPRARHRRGARPAGRPADQEAAHPARPHRRQPVLRGLDADPDLVRGRGEAALRRRHQLLRQGLQRVQGREPQGHRAHPGGDGRRRGRRPPPRLGRPAPARPLRLDPRVGGQRRRRHPRAPDPGAAGRVHDAEAAQRLRDRHRHGSGGPPGHDRRRRPAQPGRPVQRPAARDPRGRGDAGRAADPAAGRHRRVAVLDLLRPGRGAGQERRRDDAAGAARADGRRLLPQRPGVLPPLRPGRRADGASCPTTRSSCTPGR